jgi:low affinity Fe/Cu permease
MTDEPETLILRQLRAMDIKIDRVLREVQALKLHSIAIEASLGAVRKDIQNIDERLSRSELRLELRDGLPGELPTSTP